MSALATAQAHLAKAREFLQAAEVSRDLELYNAATSNALSSGINAKDAICLSLTGRTNKPDDHDDARAELHAAGPAGRQLAPTLSRLLRPNARAQYQEASVSPADARKAVDWAQRLLDGAQRVVAG